MALSIQTNVASLVAQQNLQTNSNFQNRTIQQLTSGYRINSASDDAAGLAVANKFRNTVAELTQGVSNANDGVGQLQIIDGGLTNVSNILDRLKTLATQSASQTFTGDRATLNNEYRSLLNEIDRQSANIGLSSQTSGSGNQFNTNIAVYIGGGSTQTNGAVNVDLSGFANQADSAGLGLNTTNVGSGGTEMVSTYNAGTAVPTHSTVNLNNAQGNFSGNQSFTFNIYGQSAAVTVTSGVGSASGSASLTVLNGQLDKFGITASVANDGGLQFAGGVAFSVSADATANGLTTANSFADYNAGMFAYDAGTFTDIAGVVPASGGTDEHVTITNAQGAVQLTFSNTSGVNSVIDYLNTQLKSVGISAVADHSGGFTLQSESTFTINKTQAATTDGTVSAGSLFTGAAATTLGSITLSNNDIGGYNPIVNSNASADSALMAIQSAVAKLGLIQGRVGAGQNQLNYAIQLAQSQITNFGSAQSQLRDANVAQQAANMTKAQVLQQASIAAMAQANSAPQQLLTLLRG